MQNEDFAEAGKLAAKLRALDSSSLLQSVTTCAQEDIESLVPRVQDRAEKASLAWQAELNAVVAARTDYKRMATLKSHVDAAEKAAEARK